MAEISKYTNYSAVTICKAVTSGAVDFKNLLKDKNFQYIVHLNLVKDKNFQNIVYLNLVKDNNFQNIVHLKSGNSDFM